MKALPLLSAAALLLPVTAGAALAQDARAFRTTVGPVITCEGGLCKGSPRADTIVATNATQRVLGFAGDDDIELDVVFTSGSSDVGVGGEGRDCIDGGAGNDLLLGGPGDDDRPCEFTAFVNPQAALTGGPGDDCIDGGAGNDSMDGIFDDDTLLGGPGEDLLQDPTSLDRDRLYGGLGADVLDARDGGSDDLIDGGPGRDDCTGDLGDRFLSCERVQRLWPCRAEPGRPRGTVPPSQAGRPADAFVLEIVPERHAPSPDRRRACRRSLAAMAGPAVLPEPGSDRYQSSEAVSAATIPRLRPDSRPWSTRPRPVRGRPVAAGLGAKGRRRLGAWTRSSTTSCSSSESSSGTR